jgi:hypothetical protein
MTLEKRYTGDPKLLEFYKKKLLQPGWGGELDAVELAYIKSQLKRSPSLKRRWGFRPSAKRLSERRIRAVAMDGVSAIERPVLASAIIKRKQYR